MRISHALMAQKRLKVETSPIAPEGASNPHFNLLASQASADVDPGSMPDYRPTSLQGRKQPTNQTKIISLRCVVIEMWSVPKCKKPSFPTSHFTSWLCLLELASYPFFCFCVFQKVNLGCNASVLRHKLWMRSDLGSFSFSNLSLKNKNKKTSQQCFFVINKYI